MIPKIRKTYQYFLREVLVLVMVGGATVAGGRVGDDDEGINSTACR